MSVDDEIRAWLHREIEKRGLQTMHVDLTPGVQVTPETLPLIKRELLAILRGLDEMKPMGGEG